MSKALGGSMPMAVIAFKEELNAWSPGSHTGTFRGSQMSFATGLASLKYMKKQALWDKVAEKGQLVKEHLTNLAAQCNEVGDIRGRGLMIGIELVQPNEMTSQGLPRPDGQLAADVQRECFHNKLILERGGRDGAVVRFLPPLTVSHSELDVMFEIFPSSVKQVLRRREEDSMNTAAA